MLAFLYCLQGFFKINKHQENCLKYHGNTYCTHCSIIQVSILNRYQHDIICSFLCLWISSKSQFQGESADWHKKEKFPAVCAKKLH